MLLLGLAPTQHAVVYFVIAWLLFGYGGTVYNIDQVSLRQAVTPDRMQGRMTATMRTVFWGVKPIANLSGGVMAGAFGAPAR